MIGYNYVELGSFTLGNSSNNNMFDCKGYIPCHVFKSYNEIPYLVVPVSKDFNGGIENYELNEAYLRIKTVVNGTIPEITSYNELKNK